MHNVNDPSSAPRPQNAGSGSAGQLDVGAIILAPTKDPAWLKKCALMGLLWCIPVFGWLNLAGWSKAIADRHVADGEDKDTLPDAGFHYLGAGWRFLLAYLPALALTMLVLFVGIAGVTVLAFAAKGSGAEPLVLGLIVLLYCAFLLSMVLTSVVRPAIDFLHVVDGEPWASVQHRRMWEVIKLGGTQYLLLFVVVIVAGMITQIGFLALGVGFLVSLPFGQAVIGVALAHYARVIRPTKIGYDLEGGTGPDSGTPFGVKL